MATVVVLMAFTGPATTTSSNPGPAHNSQSVLTVNRANQGAIDTTLAGGSPGTTGEPPATGGAQRATGPAPPVFTLRRPFIAEREGVGQCVAFERMRAPNAAAAGAGQSIVDSLWEPMFASFPLCPRAEAPATSPAATAAQYWSLRLHDALPKPRPVIAPGYMLAGKTAYLETNTKMAERFVHATPLGELLIDAVGQVHVDWGDGTTSGPFTEAGRPWPEGTITHSWTDTGHYDVVVTERWTATWRLAGTTGTLPGLVTEGRLEDFEVRQLQAVRNR
ncbi:MAG: hypothetical protein M3N68_12520 [Actinomycetota bacterium]|nr:hypothetical protein [Actinomycetota bacterium]